MSDSFSEIYKEAASASIQKTLKDIEAILEGYHLPSEGVKREQLRDKLRNELINLSIDWLEHGFKGGHKVAAKEFIKNGYFPNTISRKISRQFPVRKKGEKLEIELQSNLPNKILVNINKNA